jgi:hypothetical protein
MAKKTLTYSYAYRAGFPRVFDAARVPWRVGMLTEALALPGVVEAYLPQFRAGWAGADAINRESRRDLIELVTSSTSPLSAAAARAGILTWFDGLRIERGVTRLVVEIVAVDVIELT